MSNVDKDILVIVQRFVGVGLVASIFVFLTIRGSEIPERVQWMMMLGVGTLIVGVDSLVDIMKIVNNTKISLSKKEDKKDE